MSKSGCVTSILTCKENCIINLFKNIVCCAITLLYYKRNRKHSATPRVLHASLVFSKHFPRALSHHKRTRLVFYFLIKVSVIFRHLQVAPLPRLPTFNRHEIFSDYVFKNRNARHTFYRTPLKFCNNVGQY